MTIYPAAFAILVPVSAFLTTKLFLLFSGKDPLPVKYDAIDGLRGYLAVFVFLHHSAIWYYYVQKKIWKDPDSQVFDHFGKTSVSLFFMITAFLFFSRLIETRKDPVDWPRLFLSRFTRLYPVYLLSMLVVLVFAGVLTHWKLHDSKSDIAKEIFEWTTFNFSGDRPVNGLHQMYFINAGVTWSLIYEWLFYFSLPLFTLLFTRKNASPLVIGFSVLLIALILWKVPIELIHIYSFGGGIAAAFLLRMEKFRVLLARNIFSFAALILLIAMILIFHSPNSILPIIITSFVFLIIAGGNSLFGFLTLPVSKMLGKISYPLYLLHAIILFITIEYFPGANYVSHLSIAHYYLLISGTCIVSVLLCLLVHYTIELPVMNSTGRILSYFRKKRL
ncbi:MAG TPA: acyltransferase [Bacteroidia bacterium]|jgi:peptidoglycan/LPS O-acetylase OafA/YrhL|nr:acyltransferase [Bacteroidia bacterium]